jgi:hypothetical protein
MFCFRTLCGALLSLSIAWMPAAQAADSPKTPAASVDSGPLDGFDLRPRTGDRWHLTFSPFTYHYSYSEEHKQVLLLGGERERADGALAGVALFTNSFGQPSSYVYPWGNVYRNFMGYHGVFAKWTAGMLYGYKAPYENKVPLNHKGFSPGFIPAVGWESSAGYQVQINFLGNAGLMIQGSVPLSR